MSLSLSTNSFVYRMTAKAWGFFGIDPSPSLCVFFWQMVLAPFMIVAGVLLFSVICLVFFWVLIYAPGGILMDIFRSYLPDSWILPKGDFNWRFIVVSLLVWFTVIGGAGLWVYRVHRRDIKIEQGTYKPSVTIEYIKAKKRKICPFIEFK